MNKRVVGTVAGMCIVALIFFLTGSFMREATTERASEPYAGGELVDATHPGVSGEICEGMTLGQVWDMWGKPDASEFDAETHLATHIWYNPFRQILFSTDPDVWVVISHWGYTK